MAKKFVSAWFPRRELGSTSTLEKHRWFLWLWLGAAFWFAAIIEIGR